MLFLAPQKLRATTRCAVPAAACLGAVAVDARGKAPAKWEYFTPLARYAAAAINHDGMLYFLGGGPLLDNNQIAPVDSLLPGSSTWTSEVPIDAPLEGMIGAVDSFNRILLFGGYERDGDHGYIPSQKVKRYVPGEGLTDRMAPLPDYTLWYAGATDDAGRTYLLGGMDIFNHGTDLVRRYDPTTDSWESLAPLPVDGRYSGTAVYDGRGHVIFFGGYNRNTTRRESTAFSYDIASNSWKPVADQPANRSNQGGVLGADGLVYAVGGWGNANPNGWYRTRDLFVFNPVTETWSVGPSLKSERTDPSCVLRDDGYIYAVGGGLDSTTERLNTNKLRASGSARAVGR